MATYWENSCSFGLRYVSWYKYLIVSLVFSHLGFWSGNLFLIAPFPDLCLLVPFYRAATRHNTSCSNNKKVTSFVISENVQRDQITKKFRRWLYSCFLLGPPGFSWCFSFAPELVSYSAPRELHRRTAC